MVKIILTRHGETLENKLGIIQGQLPGRLSELGKEQARKLGLRLADEEIHHIYTSDLARSLHTAEAIAVHHPAVPFTKMQLLREQHFGSWQGTQHDKILLAEQAGQYVAEDGEPFESLFKRAQEMLSFLQQYHKDQTVVLVGHARINRALTAALLQKTPEDIRTIDHLHNTAVCEFHLDEQDMRIVTWNCIRHLD